MLSSQVHQLAEGVVQAALMPYEERHRQTGSYGKARSDSVRARAASAAHKDQQHPKSQTPSHEGRTRRTQTLWSKSARDVSRGECSLPAPSWVPKRTASHLRMISPSSTSCNQGMNSVFSLAHTRLHTSRNSYFTIALFALFSLYSGMLTWAIHLNKPLLSHSISDLHLWSPGQWNLFFDMISYVWETSDKTLIIMGKWCSIGDREKCSSL